MSARIAVVTGAADGIGRAIVDRLHSDGLRIGALDRDGDGLERLRHDHGGEIATAELDVAETAAVEATVPELARRLGGEVDLLVNNAGVGVEGPFFELDPQRWRHVIDVDLAGPFLVSRAIWPFLRPGGCVVNVSSIHGERALPGQVAYAAAKGGLNAMTRAMALDAAPSGIRVVGIMPGFVRTRLWDDWMRNLGDRADAALLQVTETVPSGRPAEPAEIAAAIAWAGSPEASYLTGEIITIDGGVLAQAFPRVGGERDGS